MENVKVTGHFDVERFYKTLALILSQKHGVNITVKVSVPEGKEERAG